MALRRVPVSERVLNGLILVDISKAREWDNETNKVTDKVLGVRYEIAFPGLKYTTANVTIPENVPPLFPNYEDEDFELEPGQVVELTGKVSVEAYVGRSGLGLAVEADGIRLANPAAKPSAAPAVKKEG